MNLTTTSASISSANAAGANVARELTLVDLCRRWATTRSTHRAYVYASEETEESITYAELDWRARVVAEKLASVQAPGTTALLLYPLGIEFTVAFFACLYAGVIAVPMHPGRGKSAQRRLSAVLRNCGAQSALTTSATAESFRNAEGFASVNVLATDVGSELVDVPEAPRFTPRPETIAFLQYTSGSTSEPKGTMVSHRNLITNLAMLKSGFGTDASSVVVSWLPVFHDMGLVGNVLHSAFLGATCVLISTLGFLKNPIVWLRAIARYDADFSGAPNFAYDLCVSKTTPEQRAGLDLSAWRVAFNGAEPVRARTLERFSATFGPYGFQKTAYAPGYGLAEATVLVSATAGAGPRYVAVDARLLQANIVAEARNGATPQILVGNGHPEHCDQVVAIVDPVSGERREQSEIGEIWISGSHVALGYWQNPTATERTFGGRLPEDEKRYLRTGDLGFVRDGEVFVTGRLKDLIIFRGQNFYPQDVELTLELALPEVRPGSTAAFTSAEDDTGIVLVAELERGNAPTHDDLTRVATLLREQHEVPLQRLVLVRKNTVPKTTSGKIQRQQCKKEYERGAYDVIALWEATATEDFARQVGAFAAAWIARDQGISSESVETTVGMTGYGIDSIRKVALVSALERRFGVSVPEASFFAIESIDDLVRAVPNPNTSGAKVHAAGSRANATPDGSPPSSSSAGPNSSGVPSSGVPSSGVPSSGVPSSGESRPGGRPSNAVLPKFTAMSWDADDE